MFKAVLFDLDGTLLPVDTKTFINKYFKLMKESVNYLYDPDEFVKHVWQGSKAMIDSEDDNKTNQQVFFDYFKQSVDLPEREINEFFNDFYQNQFPKLHQCIGEVDGSARKLIRDLQQRDVKIAIATNPLFPRQAIEHRLNWLGLTRDEFHLVTTYENMHFAKPSLGYYHEICSKLDLKPNSALMVGNDAAEDLIAQKVELNVFLVTDYLIDDFDFLMKIKPEYQGSFSEMESLLANNLLTH